MIKRFFEIILCLAFCLFFWFVVGKGIEVTQASVDKAYDLGLQMGNDTPKSIGETQQILKRLGYYNGNIDYKWGPLTETAYCNYCADQSFNKMAGKN